jgi:hypothetical protein
VLGRLRSRSRASAIAMIGVAHPKRTQLERDLVRVYHLKSLLLRTLDSAGSFGPRNLYIGNEGEKGDMASGLATDGH